MDHSPASVLVQSTRRSLRLDELYASYYTSPPEHDITWVMGMFRPSHIRMARIDLPALERLALATPSTTFAQF